MSPITLEFCFTKQNTDMRRGVCLCSTVQSGVFFLHCAGAAAWPTVRR